jgi:hypothetical protein
MIGRLDKAQLLKQRAQKLWLWCGIFHKFKTVGTKGVIN